VSSGLLGPDGRPIGESRFSNKKVAPPDLGEKYGAWGGPAANYFALPGGGAIMFDLDRLQIGDFRQMKDHYQVSSSLAVLMFLLHQMDWRIVCDDKKQKDFYTEAIDNVWTPLVRSMSQAFWAGASPNVLQWDNDVEGRRIVLTKIKDLIPELATPRWKKVDGAGTTKISVFDGIKQFGGPTVPVENSFWYPVLMEYGNYEGRKLLRSAFPSWFFSILLHLFANRYFERYGEPTPIGRAPFDEDIRFMGTEMHGNEAMELILGHLRNRSAVVLPNDKSSWSDHETNPSYDYQIEYLESQMRGADFERYMTRLDEEISLALFTPILMMRTANVGSYNLGNQQGMTYRWMLNAIGGDWKFYIDWYILRPMRDFNFGENAPLPKIAFRRMGAENEDLVRDVVRALIAQKSVGFDLEQLGEIAGLTLKQTKALTSTTPDPNADPNAPTPGDPTQPSQAPDPNGPQTGNAKENRDRVFGVVGQLSERIAQQVNNAYSRGNLREVEFSLGFQNQMRIALAKAGVHDAAKKTEGLYDWMQAVLTDFIVVKADATADDFNTHFQALFIQAIEEILGDVR
jgi:hypothetical protein